MKNKSGFTLMELLVTFTLAVVIFGIVVGTNFYFQIKKGLDSRRKQDLAKLQKILEDYYADKNRYPAVSEMTYAVMPDTLDAGKVCGSRYTGAMVLPYSKELPCDPEDPIHDYIYFTANNGQDYALFTLLANTTDPDISNTNCSYGCSYFTDPLYPATSISNYFFNYQVSSLSLVLAPCLPTEYIACFLGRDSPCQRCPSATCSGYDRLYCSRTWCQNSCL